MCYALYACELTGKSAAKLPAIAVSFSLANKNKKGRKISFNLSTKASIKRNRVVTPAKNARTL